MSLCRYSCRILAGCLWILLLAGTLWASQTPRQEKAEFFRLIDFDNASLLSHNTAFPGIRTQLTNAAALPSDDQALAAYRSALTNFLATLPARNYSCSRSRVLADPAAFATNFFSWIDLDRPGLEAVKAHVAVTNYPEALAAWRDYTVDKLRRINGPQLYQHSYKGHPRQQNIASLLLGEKTYTQYLADGTNLYGGLDFYEIYGMSGAPGTIGPISWTNQPPTSDTSLDTKYGYTSFGFASPLVYRYWYGQPVASGTNITLTSAGTLVSIRFIKPHGLTNGDYVAVSGASPAAYNGLFRITVSNATNAAYTASSAPGTSPATGSGRTVSKSRQAEPVRKWFEILADFSTRQKTLVSSLQLVENTALRPAYRTVYDGSDWGVHAGAVLGQSGRCSELLAALALFAKLLPEDALVQRDWYTAIQAPVTTPLASQALDVIAPEPLARIALSLMADTTEALMLAYLRVGMVPNQRFSGLLSLYLAASVFDEFKGAPELLRQTDAALTDFANTMFYPDGPMLERSPNYNEGDAAKIRVLVGLTGTNATPGIQWLAAKLNTYERSAAFMHLPLGGRPRMASDSGLNPPALWQGGSTVSNWRTSFRATVVVNTEDTATNLYAGLLDSGRPVPSATSVAFPYAGYYLMRNGWSSRAHFLYFANTPPGNGHCQMDHNGIQVCAFGRSLLSTAGPPPYDPTFVDPSQTNDFAGFALYQGEGSSFKVNTVTVDGRSQNENNARNATVTSNTMSGAWFTSPEFDYVEGTYNAGYGGSSYYNAFTNSTATVKTVTHRRSVAFLRTPGLWVVTDVLVATNAATHDYRQVWNFPAYSASFGPTYGFATNEVVADTGAQQIHTTDADGPNVHLYHLGPKTLTYETYAGSRTPYLGWSGNGIGGLRLPAANVHAVWQGVGTQLVITVIAPSDTGAASPVTTLHTNAGSATTIDVELGLANGHTLRIVQGLQPQTLILGNQSLSAGTVIADAAPDGTQCGLALAAPGFAYTNFSFTASPTNFTPTSPIQRPTNFNWTVDGTWQLPSTASPSNTPPELSSIPEQRIALNSLSNAIPFVVTDLQSRAMDLTVATHSSDQTLVPDANIVLAGTGTNRTVIVTPAPGRSGAATVSLTVTDPFGLSRTGSFALTVFTTLYWDASPVSGLQSAGGLWSGTETNWSPDPAGAIPLSGWFGGGLDAVFAGTNGACTIAVSSTQTVNNLFFSSAGHTLTSGALRHSSNALTIRTDADATINTPLFAQTNVIKTGTACLTLGAVNTYPGETTVNAGTLRIATDNALPPASGLTIGSGHTAGGLILSNASQTVRWLTFAGATNAVTNRLEIAANQTLRVTGPLLIGGTTSNTTALVEAVGAGGTLLVTNNGAVILIGRLTNSSSAYRSTLNLGPLGTFIAGLGTNGTLRVGETMDTFGGGQATLLLAATNTITVGTLGIGEGGRNYQQVLKLGTGHTTINVGTLNIGTGLRDGAAVTFPGATGTLTLRGADGTNRARLTLGGGGTTSGSGINNLIDLTGHASDLLLSTMTLGEQMRAGTATHTFSFNAGLMDVTAIVMARTSGSGTSTSTLNLGGGVVNVGTGGILLASNAIGNLSITGGSVTTDGDIRKGAGGTGTATLTLSGSNAVLDLKRHALGSGAAPVTALLQAGTLRNMGEFNGGADLEKGSAGVLTLDGVNSYAGRTRITNGIFRLTGSLENAGSVDVTAPATLDLTGTLTTDTVHIHTNAFLTGCGTIHATLVNDGIITLTCGDTVTLSGTVTNNGTLRCLYGTALDATNVFVNNGTLDLINGATNLPARFINHGLLLTSGDQKISGMNASQDIVIHMPSAPGHAYQLLMSDSLTPPVWSNAAPVQAGTGGNLSFRVPVETNHSQRFYRVSINPQP
jgi:autotransporter-associated beta strand protein